MRFADVFLAEYDQEMKTTRALLERVPEGRGDFRPHEKSMPLGYLAMHVATLGRLGVAVMTQPDFDVMPPGGKRMSAGDFTSTEQLLKTFDETVQKVRDAVRALPEEQLGEKWHFKRGGEVMFSLPRAAALRSMMMNHLIHHRGQLSVYLRLNDVPLPSIYGPTADLPL